MARKAGEVRLEKQGKRVVGICIAMVCILFAYALWGRAWPKRWFVNYVFFYHEMSNVPASYPEKLPSSAGNVNYYYHKWMFDTKTAVSFILDEEEYQEQKERYLPLYAADEEEDHQEYQEEWMSKYGEVPDWAEKWKSDYVFDEKLTTDFLKNEELEYLEEVFHDSAEHYTILAYKGDSEGGERCGLEGILCNDETNEVVMFGFTDMFRKSRK